MGKKLRRANLILTAQDNLWLEEQAKSGQAEVRHARRAAIILGYANGESIAELQLRLKLTRKSIGKWVDRALEVGVYSAIYDQPHGAVAKIGEADIAWALSIACQKPKALGYAAEVWSRSALAKHLREHALEAGHPALAKCAKSTVQRVLKSHALQPQKVAYYLERRDPEFERKMVEVLAVYAEVNAELAAAGEAGVTGAPASGVCTLSVDEKPGVQAIANTAPDLPPVPDRHPGIGRDHEYRRMGTCSIIAGLDLLTGKVIARVEQRHRSSEFIALLKDIDAAYPPEMKIRLLLDNHSAHRSRETRAYLATRPNRFILVFTPKHGSWLNLVETLFAKMTRTFLRHIRVASWEELRDRILLGIAEINAHPVIHRWKST
jgi:transposase